MALPRIATLPSGDSYGVESDFAASMVRNLIGGARRRRSLPPIIDE